MPSTEGDRTVEVCPSHGRLPPCVSCEKPAFWSVCEDCAKCQHPFCEAFATHCSLHNSTREKERKESKETKESKKPDIEPDDLKMVLEMLATKMLLKPIQEPGEDDPAYADRVLREIKTERQRQRDAASITTALSRKRVATSELEQHEQPEQWERSKKIMLKLDFSKMV